MMRTCSYFKWILLFALFLNSGHCSAQKLSAVFDKIAQLKDFQMVPYTAEEYGFPKEIGEMQMTCYGNADPREEVLGILTTLPDGLLKIDHRDERDKITRLYLEKDSSGKACLMQVFIGWGGNDLCVWLFTGAAYEYYQTYVWQAKKDLEEE